MIKPPKGGRNLVLLGTGLLVVFLLSYYFFTYIPAREMQMNQRGIRAINRLDKNLNERVEHYKNSVSQFECDYYISNLKAIEENRGSSVYFKLFKCDSLKTGNGDNYKSNKLHERLFDKRDSIVSVFRREKNWTREKRREEFTKMLNGFVKENDSALFEFKESLMPNASVDKLIEAFQNIDRSKFITIDSIVSDWNGKAYAYLGITYANALKRINNGVLFKEVILSEPDSNRVVNQNDLNLKYFRYMPSNENEANLLEALALYDEVAKEKKESNEEYPAIHIENVDITKKTISGIDYMCFTRYVQIQGKQFYLTGIIEHDEYNSGVRQVSIWVVLVFILLSLFFVLVLPIAKPFLLSNKERLKANDLMWSALALVFGISILSLLIIGVDTFAIEEKNLVNKKLAWHADSLATEFQSELEISVVASQMSSVFDYKLDQAEAVSPFMDNISFLSNNFRELDFLRNEFPSLTDVDSQKTNRAKQDSLSAGLQKILSQESMFIDALSFNTVLNIEFIRISPSGRSQLYKVAKLPSREIVDSITISFNALRNGFNDINDDSLVDRYNAYQEVLNSISYELLEINSDLDLSHRRYYQVMKDRAPQNAWSFPQPNSTGIPYYVESIFSLSSGKYTTITVTKGDGVARSSKDNMSYATDFEWESVNNRYLEPGFTFAVIDKEGSIHFHSDQRKIKNQNFIEETDFDTQLSSFLHNKTSEGFGLKFSMKDHQAFVSPLANTPWFVVVMYDIRKSRLNVTQSIITTFQVLIMILLYMLFLHVILHLDKTVSSYGQKNIFSYLFLSPLNISSRVFIFLTGFNLFQILLLILVYSQNSINLLANITIFFAMITIGILVNYQTLTKYNLTLLNLKRVGESKRVSGFEWVLLVLWIFWFVLTSVVSTADYIKYIQLIQVIIIACYLYLKVESPWKSYFLSVEFEQPYLKKILGGYFPFYMHSFTWIVLIGVVSTFLFFKPIYNMQHIKRGWNNWVEEFEMKNSSSFVRQPDHKINLFPADSSGSTPIKNAFLRESSDFVDQISLYFDEDEGSFIGQGKSMDKIKVYQCKDAEMGTPYFLIEPHRTTYRQRLIKPEANTIVAFDLPSIDHTEDRGLAILFWISIILFMWVVFFIVQALGKKFFYLNLLKRLRAVSEEVDGKKASLNKLSLAGFSDKIANLMLVGPPYSGRNSIAKGLIQKSKKCNYLDFFNKLDEEAKKIDLEFIGNPIIINNFDYRNLDYKLNDAKLDLLEKIIRLRNEHQISAPLILVSTFSTNQIIAFYKERVKSLMPKTESNEKEIESLTSSVYRWESILFGFTTYMVKLSHEPSSDFIDNELNFGSTLAHIKPQIEEFEERLLAQKSGLTEEEIETKLVEAIMDMAQNYYSAIWNACSQEEKFLLYDMAQDGLVNPKNERTLSLLVRKGLLLTTPVLRIFNRSFALFVIENISEEDGVKMERQAKKDGVWMTYKYLALFLVLVMVVFVAFVEKEMINKMTGLITAGGILLPRIVSFASSIGNMKLFGKKTT